MDAKLYRIILPVANLQQAVSFYSAIFDKKGIEVSPGRHYFNLGGTVLALYDPVSDGDERGNWAFHPNQYIYMAVPDLDLVNKKMKAMKSGSVGEIENMPWGERLFYANDPFGNPICFVDEQTIFTGA